MGLFSNKICRDDLKPGDHIYTWRNAYTYSHHGIYVGDGEVIHFTRRGDRETKTGSFLDKIEEAIHFTRPSVPETRTGSFLGKIGDLIHFTRGGVLETRVGTFLDKITSISIPKHGGGNYPCLICGDQSNLDGVISSCLDCFLSGGNLYLYEYGVSKTIFMANPRSGTCTIAPSDPSDEVISRGKLLLQCKKGFGAYDLLEKNCEDFAIYCKTGLVVPPDAKFRSSGQASSVAAAGGVLKRCRPALLVPLTLGSVVSGGLVLASYGTYCFVRMNSDVGVRKDVCKIPVKDLATFYSDNNKKSGFEETTGQRVNPHTRLSLSLSVSKMGLLSNKISRDNLKPGDHIYSWRRAYIYSHHGIYVGDGEVIHFTQGSGLETGTGTFLDKFIVSSIPNHGGDNNPCLRCGDQSNLNGVISSCLDCFLAGGSLYLFEYNVSKTVFMAIPRGGICTTAPSDPSEEAISRAKFLLSKNGFGFYHLFQNNCEDFATYCKTGLVVLTKQGSSGQANSVFVARSVFSWSFAGSVASLSSAAKYALSSTSGSAVTGVGGGALVEYGKYCVGRLNSDIGVRNDVVKLDVERLVEVIAIIKGRGERTTATTTTSVADSGFG